MMPYEDAPMNPQASGDGGLSVVLRSALMPREDEGKKEKKPKADDLQKRLDRIRPNFAFRNRMLSLWRGTVRVMSEYQPLIDGWRQTDSTDDDRPIPITEPAAIINDRIRKVGGMGARIKVAADNRSQEAFAKADKSQAFVKNFRDRANKDHRRAGQGLNRQQGLTRYLSEDGHCYEKLFVVPERREMPFSTRFLDTLDVYPVWGYDDGLEVLKEVFHVVEMEACDLREMYGKKACGDRQDDEKVTVVNYYCDDYTGVWEDGKPDEMLRPFYEHGYGCIPIVPRFNKGLISRADSATWDVSIREAFRGRGLIADHMGVIDRLGRHLAAAQRQLYKAVDPPLHASLGTNDQGVEINTGPAEITTTTDPQTKLALLPQDGQAFTIITTLMQVAKDALSVDQLMLDPNQARQSGFDRVVASLEAQVVLNDLVETLQDHEADVAERVLKMLKKMYPNRMQAILVGAGLIEPDPKQPIGPIPMLEDEEGRQVQTMMTGEDVPDYIRVNVQLETVNDLNRVQMGQQLLQQIGVTVSQYGALVAMDHPDPKAEMQRMATERAMQSPEAQAIFGPIEIIRAINTQMQEAMDQQDMMAYLYFKMQRDRLAVQIASGPPPPAAPPGMPGMPPSLPPSSLGGGVSLPPNTGTAPGMTPPSTATMGMDQMAGAAQAMAGFGGL